MANAVLRKDLKPLHGLVSKGSRKPGREPVILVVPLDEIRNAGAQKFQDKTVMGPIRTGHCKVIQHPIQAGRPGVV